MGKTTTKLSVTSAKDLEKYAQGSIQELPAFADGQPFVARLRRPSMLSLMKQGKIPNALLVSANEIFQNGVANFDTDDTAALANVMGVMEVIVEASLIEPTYSQILEAGLELTDEQTMAIFSFSQEGVKALEKFR